MSHRISLIDATHTVVAVAIVDDNASHYTGTVNIECMPEYMLKTFEQYEALANDQVLGLLDMLDEQIAEMMLTVVFGDGRKSVAADLQIFPKAGTISFRAILSNSFRNPTDLASVGESD